jgi:hypothetical protein
MSDITEQPPRPVARDPNNVPETFVNGNVNFVSHGDHVVLTFTQVRADIEHLMQGRGNPDYSAIVVARIAMPTPVAHALHSMLTQVFGPEGQTPKGPITTTLH